jgi:hypothetical protein
VSRTISSSACCVGQIRAHIQIRDRQQHFLRQNKLFLAVAVSSCCKLTFQPSFSHTLPTTARPTHLLAAPLPAQVLHYCHRVTVGPLHAPQQSSTLPEKGQVLRDHAHHHCQKRVALRHLNLALENGVGGGGRRDASGVRG